MPEVCWLHLQVLLRVQTRTLGGHEMLAQWSRRSREKTRRGVLCKAGLIFPSKKTVLLILDSEPVLEELI